MLAELAFGIGKLPLTERSGQGDMFRIYGIILETFTGK